VGGRGVVAGVYRCLLENDDVESKASSVSLSKNFWIHYAWHLGIGGQGLQQGG